MRMGFYYSLYEWFHPLYLQDKQNGFRTHDDGSVDNDSNASVDGGTSEDYDIYQNLEIEPDNELYGNGTEAHDANEDDVGLYDDLDQVDQQISTIEVKTPISVFGNYYLCERFVCQIGLTRK